MKKLQPTEYMYASARIRSLENRLVGRERMEVLIEAHSTSGVVLRTSSADHAADASNFIETVEPR